MFDLFLDVETKTKHGFDKLDIAIHFMPILEGKNVAKEFNRFKSYLVSQIKRGLTPQEKLNLAEGLLKYVQSEPETDERMKAINYLFDLGFLSDQTA